MPLNFIAGVSCSTVEGSVAAEKGEASYLGMGAIYPTCTKGNTLSVTHEGLSDIRHTVDVRIVVIGGVKQGNISDFAHTGNQGVSVVSAMIAQPDIAASARDLRTRFDALDLSLEPGV